MEDNRISYHESVRMVYDRIKHDNMTNIWDRYEAQGMGTTRTSDAPSVWVESVVICVPMVPAVLMWRRIKGEYAV